MVATRQDGRLEMAPPEFRNGTLHLEITFRADVVIAPSSVSGIMHACLDHLKAQLERAGYSEFKWPPITTEVTPHSDFKGLEASLYTPAREPGKPVIMQ